MSAKKQHPIRDKVVAGLLVAAILGVIGWLWKKWALVWPYVQSGVSWFLHGRIATPVWLLALLCLAALLVVAIIVICAFLWVASKRAGESSAGPKLPAWINYTRDEFDGVNWEWSYSGNQVVDLQCYCPRDKTPLTPHILFGEVIAAYHCDTCQTQYLPPHNQTGFSLGAIERRIAGKIRNGEWQQAAQRTAQT